MTPKTASLIDLSGRVALVTGGTRGIGRACVAMLAQAGALVHFCGRRAESVAAATREMRDAGLDVEGHVCDVTNGSALQALVMSAAQDRLDIVVGNVGANPAFGALADMPETAFDKVIDVNLRANLRLAQAALPRLAASGGGSFIVISSISALRGEAGLGAYGIAKAADLQLVRALAVEWGERDVRVNAVLPGLVKTRFSRVLWEDEARAEEARRRTALKRFVEADDVAAIVLFLAGPMGRALTGQAIVCDNGETAVLAH